MYPYYWYLVEKFQTSKPRNHKAKTYPCSIGDYAHRSMVKSLNKGLLKKMYLRSELVHIHDHNITQENTALKEDPLCISIQILYTSLGDFFLTFFKQNQAKNI